MASGKTGSVAPRAGAWIEMSLFQRLACIALVAPRAGAWIEMPMIPLKLEDFEVAPRAGAWIEMEKSRKAKPR